MGRATHSWPWVLAGALTAGAFVAAGTASANPIELVAPGLAATASSVIGAVVAVRLPRHRVAHLLLAGGLLSAVHVVCRVLARSRAEAGDERGAGLLGWLATWTFPLWMVVFLVALPLLFPTGSVVSSRWRPVLWLTGFAAAIAVAPSFVQGPLDLWDGDPFGVDNPFGIPGVEAVVGPVADVYFPLVALLAVASLLSLVVRFRRAGAEVRQQLTWVLAAVAALAISLLLDELPPPGTLADGAAVVTGALVLLSLCAVPVSAGVAVLRYRLYDLDVVVSRIALHALLVLLTTLAYAGAVAASGASLGEADATSIAVAAVAAVALQPVRTRLQQRINLVAFGFRRSPTEAASLLSRTRAAADPAELMPAALAAAAQALRMDTAVLESPDGTTTARYGGELGAQQWGFPLTILGSDVGRLVVSSQSRRLEVYDAALVEEVTRELAGCVEAASLRNELSESRTRLVTAREEERRRLRRDLHDGLGSRLTGMVLKLQAAQGATAERATELAGQVEQEARDALDDVRRLLYALRPPALDELGLVGAVRSEVERTVDTRGPEISVHADDDIPELPAAVEVAAYRIVLEALSNVRRHAGATRCEVSLRWEDCLALEVRDDGDGLSEQWRPGIGVSSIRERAQELGGTWSIMSVQPRGTKVSVRLPVGA